MATNSSELATNSSDGYQDGLLRTIPSA
eukprot:SAG11_NODE_15462_length_577_cov_1.236402_1_plen_27_part_10